MRHRHDDIRRLAAILEAEYNGRSIDSAEARTLAWRLNAAYPDIAGTMELVARRMDEPAGTAAATP